MDKTSVYMDTPQNDKLSEKGNKDILVGTTGRDKLRISAAITISISGYFLDSFVIAKGKGKRNLFKVNTR
jgi:hypothetical protein